MPDQKQQEEKPIRARFPEEDAQFMYRRTSDRTAYPDQVYQAQQRPAAPVQPSPQWAQGGSPHRFPHTLLWLAIAVVSFLILCYLGYTVTSLYQPYGAFRQKAAIVAQDTFAQGILVDGLHIGGMTRKRAEEALESNAAQHAESLWITVRVDGKTWVVTPEAVPLERNTQAVLDTAYAIGRQGSKETIASYITPFEYRYAHLYHTVTTPVSLYTAVTYNNEKLWSFVRSIERQVNRAPVDAAVATFDFSTRTFTFAQEREGAKLDAEALYRQIAEALDQQRYTATIFASTTPVMPSVTKVELMNAFTLVSSYTTKTTDNQNRNKNIQLAAAAVNGTAVMPGETFSFNTATGQRTEEKGYRPAAAIADGTTIEEVGGGVCQVSSTLFNAAAMANLTIVERSPHAWPSNYVDAGRDATVNWPTLDFTFRNDKTTPVFLVAYYENQNCTVEIYGATLDAGMSIDLVTRTTAVIDPPGNPLYEQNLLLAPGTMQEKKKARTGYTVETYKIYRQNGREIKREMLCISNYPMIQQVLEFN